MTRDDFANWLKELQRRMPDTARWLRDQEGVATFWYEDVFSGLEYDVCVSALAHVWRDGLAAYDRERLPSMIMKKHGEIQFRRSESDRRAAQRRRDAEGKGTFYGDPVMRRAMDEAVKVREKEGDHSMGAFVDQYFDDRQHGTAEEWFARRTQGG